MSDEVLPEELISEILRHALHAPPDVFLDPAHDRAWFARPDAPPSPLAGSALLRVSRRWRRIGTPLLFAALWLSRAAHTRTVLRVLRESPALGALVRDLRLDGGFVPELRDAVALMPGVRNVHLSWVAGKGHDTDGLWEVMPMLRPRRLWLGTADFVEEGRQELVRLMNLLATCFVDSWDTLEFVHLIHWYPMLRVIADALQHAPALKTMSVHAEDVYNWSWSADSLSFLDNPSLQTILCRTSENLRAARDFLEKRGVKKRITDRLTLVSEGGPLQAASAPQQRPEVFEGMRMIRI
ncbi:hypothetical protein PsYK624_035120 [Phanerochaete sordida]|uniref:Uncharacterized protein n=1 Tax=Phanerochaete sordida TaxID=48140 RepID=A0A9P3LAD7_9APHY|nr:hypothetical protein PsYK624_035120 [Phanerochaete sordida]